MRERDSVEEYKDSSEIYEHFVSPNITWHLVSDL